MDYLHSRAQSCFPVGSQHEMWVRSYNPNEKDLQLTCVKERVIRPKGGILGRKEQTGERPKSRLEQMLVQMPDKIGRKKSPGELRMMEKEEEEMGEFNPRTDHVDAWLEEAMEP